MYMTLSLVLLASLSAGLAFIWHRRVISFQGLLTTFRNRFGHDNIPISDKQVYTQCLSHQWALDHVFYGGETKFEDTIRNLVNDRTLLGILVLGILICPLIAILVFVLYKSFAFLGASIAIFIVAAFALRAPTGVNVSYELLSWLKMQKASELKENDIAYTRVSLKTMTRWKITLGALAVASVAAAPWGEVLPDVLANATSGFFVLVLTLIYPPLASYSADLAFIVTLYAFPLLVCMMFIVISWATRNIMSAIEDLLD
jgi:hypothetical protein